MKKFTLIILLLFVSACTLPSLPFMSKAQPSTGRGIKLEFIDYPKGELDEEEPFTIDDDFRYEIVRIPDAFRKLIARVRA